MADTTRDIKLLIRTEIDKALRDLDKAERQLDEVGKSAEKSGKGFGNLAAGVKAFISALAVREVARFAVETARLAGEAEGLRRSLKNLADKEGVDAIKLMKDLRSATVDTVSDIELMRNATQAKFLGIDLKNLPILFEFARRRAQDTGQSIDYLVNSIVTGIGRKSPLILDNLGLQMKDLNDEVEKIARATGTWTGRVDDNLRALHLQEAAVNIARKGIEESGDDIETAVTKLSRMNAQWENFKVLIDKISSGPTLEVLDDINFALSEFSRIISHFQFSEDAPLAKLLEHLKSSFEAVAPTVEGTVRDFEILLSLFGDLSKINIEDIPVIPENLRGGKTKKPPPTPVVETETTKQKSDADIKRERKLKDRILDIQVELLRRRDELQAAYDELQEERLNAREMAELETVVNITDAEIEQNEKAQEIIKNQLLEQIEFYNQVAGIISNAFVGLAGNLADSASKGSKAWNNFFRNLKIQIAQFLASKVLDKLLETLGNILFPGAGSILGGIGDVLGFQEGGFVKGSQHGRIIKIGENYTDEIVIPVAKLGIPNLTNLAPPAISGFTGGVDRFTERTFERNTEKILKLEVEGIFPNDRELRARLIDWNRNVMIPDQRYVDRYLSTKKGEFE